ncbi:DUF3040 domain-containing protein [Pseudonocardia lacus]|uniref:DUF3040 domain-containing protein n=1 Tax=Pseudonocardia lacus TaxID=2835865 RepID=UPI001BDD0805|nr:DUF3040 domain-containing protein [Pseudonocardia lacus]
MLDDRERELLRGIERRLLVEDPALVGLFGPAPRPRHVDHRWGVDVVAGVAGLTLCAVLLIGPRPPTDAEIAAHWPLAPPTSITG